MGIAHYHFDRGLFQEYIQHGGGSILALIKQDIIIRKNRSGKLKFLQVEIMRDLNFRLIHFGQKMTGAFFDHPVEGVYKLFSICLLDRVQVIQVLHLGLIAVAEISNELTDMIGKNKFGMTCSISTE